jgi:hypothetical protein
MLRNPTFSLSLALALVASGLTVAAAPAGAQSTGAGLVFNVGVSRGNPDIVSYEFRRGEESQELQFLRVSTGATYGLRQAAAPSTGSGFVLPGLGTSTSIKQYSGDLDWRPVLGGTANWFAYASGEPSGVRVRINYLNADGTLSDRQPLALPGDRPSSSPRWSPNGRHLAYVSDSGALYIAVGVDQLLRNPSAPVRLTQAVQGVRVLFPAWSPSGRYIAYQTERDIRGTRRYVIEVVPVDSATGAVSGTPVVVTNLPLENAYRPSWSPDEKYVAFYMDRGAADGTRDLDIGVTELLVDANTRRLFSGEVKQGRRTRRLAEAVVANDTRGPAWVRIEGDVEGGQRRPLPGLMYAKRDASRGNPVTFAALDRWLANRPEDETNVELSNGWETRNHKSVVANESNGRIRLAYAFTESGGELVRTRDVPAAFATATVAVDNAAPSAGRAVQPDPVKTVTESKPVEKTTTPVVAAKVSRGNPVVNLIPGVMQLRQGRPLPALAILATGAAAGYVMMTGMNVAALTPDKMGQFAGGLGGGLLIYTIGLIDGHKYDRSAATRVSTGVVPMRGVGGNTTPALAFGLRHSFGR